MISEVTEGEGGLYYTYDAIGRTSQVVPYLYFGSGDSYYLETYTEKATYTYNAKNQLETITTATTTYIFTYDDFGNTESIKAGESSLVLYEYADNNGKLEKMTYGNGNYVVYSYDELDRISELCYTYTNSSGQTVTESYLYSYTAAGEIHSVKSTEADREYVFIRDSDGRAVFYNEIDSTSGGELLKISYAYDEQNRLSGESSKITYTTSSGTASAWYDVEIEYNDDGTLLEYCIQTDDSIFVDLGYTYDGLNRITEKTVAAEGFSRTENYTYTPLGGMTTNQIGTFTSTIGSTSTTYSYAYDTEGNITHITDGNGNVTHYEYDNLGQLTREDNPYLGKSYTYTYDNAGNRTSKKTYAYTTGTLGTATATQNYSYNTDSTWGDQLAGTTYDNIGNPLNYNGHALTWNGRQLMELSMAGGQFKYSFTYNADGIRTSKNSSGTLHTYTLNGAQIVSEQWGQRMLVYLYDESGAPIGLQYRQNSYAAGEFDTYYFEKNIFGDIVAVYNEDGDKIGSYTYDAWGNCTTTVVSGNTTLESAIVRNYNPFRYRGYYYDTETQLYYLQSRYYNPAWGRFLNADSRLNIDEGVLGYNIYAYCLNNPVNGYDPCGTCFHRWDFWNDCDKCGGKNLGTKFGDAVSAVSSAAVSAGKAVGNAVVSAGKAVGNAVVTAGKAIGSAAVTAGKAIGNAAVSAWNWTKGAAQTAWGGVKAAGKAVGNFVVDRFSTPEKAANTLSAIGYTLDVAAAYCGGVAAGLSIPTLGMSVPTAGAAAAILAIASLPFHGATLVINICNEE